MSALQNSVDLLAHFFIKEFEHTWRVKFSDCKEFINKKGVDQIKVIIDLKGIKLKDITNKQMLSVYKQLILEVQRCFPELVEKIYILNAPMFFEGIWDDELSQTIEQGTRCKIELSSSNTHDDLLEEVDSYDLPSLYGGQCQCEATCVYSEKGPWTEVENRINYRDPKQALSDEDSDLGNEGIVGFNKKNMSGFSKRFGGLNEELKMQEDDDDNIDLLG